MSDRPRTGGGGLGVRNLFDPNPGLRTEAEWRALLGELIEALSRYTGIAFAPTSWYTGGDTPGHASSSNCVNVRGTVNHALALEACGVVCISITFGKAAHASADVLLFSGGRRVVGPDDTALVSLRFREDGWNSQGWVSDETGEWESHSTDARWRRS